MTATNSTAYLILLLGVAQAPTQATQDGLAIEVHVSDYVGIKDGSLLGAEQETVRIFKGAGVAIDWRWRPISSQEARANPACRLPDAPIRLTLRLLTNAMADKLGAYADIFGSARLPDLEGFATLADIYAERIRQQSRNKDFELILGRAFAHELGHLLLGKNAHSPAGIMHTPWRPRDLERARQAAMTFSASEGKRIRAAVRARIEVSATSPGDTVRFRACEQANNGEPRSPALCREGLPARFLMAETPKTTSGLSRIISIGFPYGPGAHCARQLKHLLLGEGSHTSTRVMRPPFGSRDLALESRQFMFESNERP